MDIQLCQTSWFWSVALHGEAGSVNVVHVCGGVKTLRDKLQNYEVSFIFNMDETRFFFKLLSQRTYILQTENSGTVRGTKDMKGRDWITAYLCTYQIGKKLTMAIIGNPKNPKCLRILQPPLPYFSQKNAWLDGVTFRAWFNIVFLPFVLRYNSNKVALIIENCVPHGEDVHDPREQVSSFTFLPN